jgi:WD40 repeat protein
VADANTTEGSVSVRIWNIQEKRFVAQCQNPGSSPLDFTMAWSPDSASLAVYTGRARSLDIPTVQVWQVSDGRLLWKSDVSHPGNDDTEGFGWIKWSPDGTALAYAYLAKTDRLGVLDAQTGATRFQADLAETSHATIGEAFAWSPDSAFLACTALEQGTPVIQAWDARLGQRLFTCQHVPGRSSNVSWSPDGRYLAAGTFPNATADTALQFWDAHSGKALFSYHAPDYPTQLLWSPDSHFLATFNPQNSTPCALGAVCHPYYIEYALQVFQVM